jgi:hypothetical protein
MSTVMTPLLQTPYRPIRPVAAGQDAPWPGMLVSLPAGGLGVAVDASLLPAEWWGWQSAQTDHVLTPIDIARRTDGHDVILPAFSGPLGGAIDRRRTGIATGEAVTVAVSILRGLAALGGERLDHRGEWWLTLDSRPVLVTDVGETTAVDASVGVLRALSRALGHDLADRAAQTVAGSRLSEAALESLERALFAVAAPMPFAEGDAVGLHAPGPRDDDVISSREAAADGSGGRPLLDRLARHVDADLADLLSRTTTDVWRRLRAPRSGGRRRPLIVASVVAAGVMLGGVMWPAGGSAVAGGERAGEAGPSSAPTVAVEPSGSALGVHEGTAAAGSSDPAAQPDLAAVTAELLDARIRCGGAAACLTDVAVAPDREFEAGVIDLDVPGRTITLLDEFGGVAVLRVEAADEPAQLVVIQFQQDRWLLRDAYAAQEPR